MMRMRAIASKRRRFSVGVSLGAVVTMAVSALLPLGTAQATGLTPLPLTIVPCDTGNYFVDSTGLALYGGPGQYTDANSTLINGGNCSGSLVFGSNVSAIDAMAFIDSTLTGVTFSSTITSIGEGAFGNTGLTQVTIPNSVVTIGRAAFTANAISSLVLGSSVTTIGSGAFLNSPLTSLTIPSTVTSIGSSAFAAATLSSLVIPSSVTSIGSSAFRNSPLTSLSVFSPSLTLGNSAFLGTGSNLRCFYNFGNATFTSAALTAAGLPNPCVIHSIGTSVGANGSLTGTYAYIDDGATPVYTFTPASGYMVDSVSVDSTDVTDHLVAGSGQVKSYTFAPVTADHRISVSFKVIPAPAPVSPPAPAPVSPAAPDHSANVPETPAPTPTPIETTPTPTPTPPGAPGTPGTPAKSSTIKLSGFAPGSAVLTKALKAQLVRLASKFTKAANVVVTGFTEGPTVLATDSALSRRRAITVSSYIRKLVARDVHIVVSHKQLTRVGSRFRAVELSVLN
jgi:outer membrane protein OmpA-like peptidoglycan-associated protein